jgi:hypothetical protein
MTAAAKTERLSNEGHIACGQSGTRINPNGIDHSEVGRRPPRLSVRKSTTRALQGGYGGRAKSVPTANIAGHEMSMWRNEGGQIDSSFNLIAQR